MNEYERAQKTIAALRAELDAAKAANAKLEAERDEARAALFACGDMGSKTIANGIEALDASRREWHQIDAGRIAALEAERDEARGLVRKVLDEVGTQLPAILLSPLQMAADAWDAERAAPDTNRDAGDESGV